MTKLSDNQFWTALENTGGLFAQAVEYIKKEFGIEITRQAVRDRALKDKDRLEQINEANLDLAEDTLIKNIKSKVEQVAQRAVEFYLKCKGKKRGYIERQEITGADNEPLKLIIQRADRNDKD